MLAGTSFGNSGRFIQYTTSTPGFLISDANPSAFKLLIFTVEPPHAVKTTSNGAIKNARAGDVILLAGKGHENYQEIAGVKYPFSDFEIAQQMLQERTA